MDCAQKAIINLLNYIIMFEKNSKEPSGQMIELNGVQYLVIDGVLYRYADMTLDRGFKIVLGSSGSDGRLATSLLRCRTGSRSISTKGQSTIRACCSESGPGRVSQAERSSESELEL